MRHILAGGPRRYFYADKVHRALKNMGVSHVYINNIPGAKVDHDYGMFMIGLDKSTRVRDVSEDGWSITPEGNLSFNRGGESVVSFMQTRLARSKGKIFLEKISSIKDFTPVREFQYVRGTSFDYSFIAVIRFRGGVAKFEVDPFKEWNMKSDRAAKEELRKVSMPPLEYNLLETIEETIVSETDMDGAVEELVEILEEEENIEIALTSEQTVEARKLVEADLPTVSGLEKTLATIEPKLRKIEEKMRNGIVRKSGWKVYRVVGTDAISPKEQQNFALAHRLLKLKEKGFEEVVGKLNQCVEEKRVQFQGTSLERSSVLRRKVMNDSQLLAMYDKVRKESNPAVKLNRIIDQTALREYFTDYMTQMKVDEEVIESTLNHLPVMHVQVQYLRHFIDKVVKAVDSDSRELNTLLEDEGGYLLHQDNPFSDRKKERLLVDEEDNSLVPLQDKEQIKEGLKAFKKYESAVRMSKVKFQGVTIVIENKSPSVNQEFMTHLAWCVRVLSQYPQWKSWAMKRPITIEFKPKIRACYQHLWKKVYLSTTDKPWVLIHEMFHTLEYVLPGLDKLVTAFLVPRVKWSNTNIVKNGEHAFEDGFHDLYAGKLYFNQRSSIRATEFITMGAQEFVSETRARKLAAKDYSHFLFMVAVLDGSIKKYL